MIGMPSRRAIIALAFASTFPITALAAEPDADVSAPFGLKWGMSSEEVRKTGVQLTANAGRSEFGAVLQPVIPLESPDEHDDVVVFLTGVDRMCSAGWPPLEPARRYHILSELQPSSHWSNALLQPRFCQHIGSG